MNTAPRRFHIGDGEIMQFLAAFLLVFVGAKFGQYLFFEWNTSPAILWPPTGLAFAIIWMWGYRYAVPVFLALFLATIFGQTTVLIPSVVTTPLGQVLGSVAGVYILRRYGFDGTFSTMRNVLAFLVVSILACSIAPTITTVIAVIYGTISTSPYVSWSRSFAGYVFSCLILFPLIVSWAQSEDKRTSDSGFELAFIWALLLSSVYFLFWTHGNGELVFPLFALFFIAHLWTCLRFSTRIVSLAIFITTSIGILGLFVSPNPDRILNSQLISMELFLFLVIPIFYAFSALVKERANTIAELKTALERIEKENNAKNDFVAVLAHELRNPLSPIKSILEILTLEELTPDLNKLIKGAQLQVHSMRRLLDDLLDTTRLTQGRFKLQIVRANLSIMMQHCVDSVQDIYEERNHILIWKEPCDESVWIDVDPVRFEQVIVNILTNAAKYTNVGGRIVMNASVTDTMAVVTITDNGVGIDKEHLKDVFQSFWQGETSLPRASGGIGVGLALTKQIVEMHGGTIKAESEGSGKGTTFMVTFPLSVQEPVVISEANIKKVTIPPFKILVVDDNVAAADALSKLLNLKGHIVQTVYCGNDVLEVTKTFSPQVILLDIGLPDMSGYEVTKTLRSNGFTERIVALTGYGQKEDTDKAFEVGFNHHLVKPMAIARLEDYLLTLV